MVSFYNRGDISTNPDEKDERSWCKKVNIKNKNPINALIDMLSKRYK